MCLFFFRLPCQGSHHQAHPVGFIGPDYHLFFPGSKPHSLETHNYPHLWAPPTARSGYPLLIRRPRADSLLASPQACKVTVFPADPKARASPASLSEFPPGSLLSKAAFTPSLSFPRQPWALTFPQAKQMAAGRDAKPTQRAQGLPLKALFSHWSLAPCFSGALEAERHRAAQHVPVLQPQKGVRQQDAEPSLPG